VTVRQQRRDGEWVPSSLNVVLLLKRPAPVVARLIAISSLGNNEAGAGKVLDLFLKGLEADGLHLIFSQIGVEVVNTEPGE
jgi:hypothetical protein